MPNPLQSLAILLFLTGWARAEKIEVEQQKPVVSYITFDPAHPPADMPKLKADEKAFCAFSFWIDTNFSFRIIDGDETEPQRLTIRAAKVTLKLKIDVYLPKNASAKLKAHEEGHRHISERVYEQAEQEARKLLAGYVGKTFKLEAGADPQAFVQEAARACTDGYHKQVTERSVRVNDRYDEITAHGRKPIAEQKAIELAFDGDGK